MKTNLLLLPALLLVGKPLSTRAATLVKEGQAMAAIVLPATPAADEELAAAELVEHIAAISGAKIPILNDRNAVGNLLPLMVGGDDNEALKQRIAAKGNDPWAFAIAIDETCIRLVGLSPAGTLAAAYALLEQLGARWFMPGEVGRVLPSATTLTLPHGEHVEAPSFSYRRGPAGNEASKIWSRRLRLPGVGGRYGAHGIAPLSGSQAKAAFEEDPRLFALVDGERKPSQLCLTYSTSNPAENKTLERVAAHYRTLLRQDPDLKILNMGPNDGGGFCQCDECRRLDPPGKLTVPLQTPSPSYTDRYVWFFNQLTDRLAAEFPAVRIGFYAYGALQLPPAAIQPHDNLAISLAPIHTCRIHGPNNPVCPESNFPLWLLEAWRPFVGNYIADRGYLFNLACPGLPFSMVHRVREEIPAFWQRGVRIWSADPSTAWASHNPTMYIVAKLLWNHEADVDALLQEFYHAYYGPAAATMANYHQLLDTTIRDADFHTGGSWDMPHIYPPAIRQQARTLLEQALGEVATAADGKLAQRVTITRDSLDLLDAYCELLDHRNHHNFVAEMAALEQMETIRDRLLEGYEYPMLNPMHANQHIGRFIRRMTNANYETLAKGGKLVAALTPVWHFSLDPHQWGRYLGLQRAESRGGNWQTIRSDTSWSNQGLRYYFGQAWYRQEILLPATQPRKPLYLWFAGVDRTAEVWLNGKFVGANHGGTEFDLDAYGSSFRAFEFDVSAAVQYGTTNVVTLRIVRPGTAELGTGGLIGPAMFYTKGDE